MKKLYTIFVLSLFSFLAYANDAYQGSLADSSKVIAFNENAFKSRLTNQNETINTANKALELALKIGYQNGAAEAYRVRGIGKYYMNKPDSAINDYFEALKIYENTRNLTGKGKVYNNIGNLYQEIDNDQALIYFNKAAAIAEATHNDPLIAALNLNMGNVYYHKKSFNQALKYILLSYKQFTKLDVKVQIIQCLQDLGAVYFSQGDIEKAEQTLLQANQAAKALDLNSTLASIDLELSDIYLKSNKFDQDEKFLKEGMTFSKIINNEKDIYDYNHSWYELESRRKNYEKALLYLSENYKKDSLRYYINLSTNISLEKNEKEHQAAVAQAASDKKNASQRFWLLAIAAGLLLVVIALLTSNVKRKATTNSQLQELNNEISRQKDNLDRINHHLEEIIDERTRDLQVKNKKLSEYSSYLSHQIRGPIATLKGLMNLEKEGLVDQAECINMMDKCVSEIDEKIIEMSDMLHNPEKTSFLNQDDDYNA